MTASLARVKKDGDFVVLLGGADPDRARRILEAAVLQINDRAPELFTGPIPLNTNASDIGSYGPVD